jgi:hypothetical protein
MFGFRFIKIPPTTHVIQYSGGNVVREGTGLSFFYYSPTTSLVSVPLGSTDVPFIFEEQTGDYQTVSLQGQITYRIADPKKLAGLMDFTLAAHGRAMPRTIRKIYFSGWSTSCTSSPVRRLKNCNSSKH